MPNGTVAAPRPELHTHLSRTRLSDVRVGAAIRRRRNDLNQHLDAVSRCVGINQSVLSRIERGERPCRVTELQAIAAALGTSASELLRRAKQEPAPSALRAGNCPHA